MVSDLTPSRYASRPFTRVVTVSNEYFTATARLEKRDGAWRVLECSKELAWMKHTNEGQWKNELIRRGCRWEWM